MRYLMFLIIITLISCKSNQDVIKEKMIGAWDITDMTYKDNDYKEKLLINAFTIGKEGVIVIPDTIDSEILDEELVSRWSIKQIDKNKIELLIDCGKNPVFKGTYDVRFFKEYDKKLLGVELKSETTHISAYKVLQNFDTDGKDW